MNILERIQEMVKEYRNKHGKEPSNVYLTLEDEIELTGLGKEKLGGKIVSQIIVNGARKTLPTIYGLAVHWDSQKTYVE